MMKYKDAHNRPGAIQPRMSTAAMVMRLVNSTTAMTPTNEESFNKAMKSLVIGGKAVRKALENPKPST